MVEFINMN